MTRLAAICLLLLPSAVPMAAPQMSMQQHPVPHVEAAGHLRAAPSPGPAAARTTTKRVVVKVTPRPFAARPKGTKSVTHHPVTPKPAVTSATTRPHLQPHTHAGLVAFAASLPYPWGRIITCESIRDDSWRPSSSSHARGILQFMPSTWRSLGLTGDPATYSWRDQYAAAVRLRARDGLGQWDCARILGLA